MKNKNLDIVKKFTIKNKIDEHFRKNPKSKQLVLSSADQGGKTYWKATKESNDKIVVTEIATKREQFIFEQDTTVPGRPQRPKTPTPTGTMPAGTPAQMPSRSNRAYSRSMAPPRTPPKPGQPNWPEPMAQGDYSTPPKTTSVPQDMQQQQQWNPMGMNNQFYREMMKAGSFKQAVMKMPDDQFKTYFRNFGAQSKQQLSPDVLAKAKDFYSQHLPQLKKFAESKKRKVLRIVKEDRFQEKEKGDIPVSGEMSKDVKPDKKVQKPKGLEKKPPKEEKPEVEKEPASKEDPGDIAAGEKTREQELFSKSLQGASIKSGNVNLPQGGGSVDLVLTDDTPITISWTNAGQVVLRIRERPFFLRR